MTVLGFPGSVGQGVTPYPDDDPVEKALPALALPPELGIFLDMPSFRQDLRTQPALRNARCWQLARRQRMDVLGINRPWSGEAKLVRVAETASWAELRSLNQTERITARVIERGALGGLEQSGPLPDVFVLGQWLLYRLVSDEAGIPVGVVRYSDPDLIRVWTGVLRRLYRHGEQVSAYLDRHVLRGESV